jgi:hypothetical protein
LVLVTVIIIVGAGVLSLVAVFWQLNRPIADPSQYRRAVAIRIVVAAVAPAVGLVATALTGEAWPAAVGFVAGLPALLVALPSAKGRERQLALATEGGDVPESDVWGSADEDEEAPWDPEHGQHGH